MSVPCAICAYRRAAPMPSLSINFMKIRARAMATLTEKVQGLDFKATGLADGVSETLSQAILEGVLKGGDQLFEVKLQARFGISRSPLREAFRDLEKKGLVVIVPRKGTFVKTVTRKDIEENFPVRTSLEGLSAKIAFKNINNNT